MVPYPSHRVLQFFFISPLWSEVEPVVRADENVQASIFFFSSRRRHTRSLRDWVQTCALPISLANAAAITAPIEVPTRCDGVRLTSASAFQAPAQASDFAPPPPKTPTTLTPRAPHRISDPSPASRAA